MAEENPVGFALPEGNRTGPNCGVTAVAICAGVPFDDAWRMVARHRVPSTRWQGMSNWSDQTYALRQLGCTILAEQRLRRQKWSGRRWINASPTLASWALMHTRKGATYLINVTGHALVYRDGWVIDQNGAKPIARHHSRRSRMWSAAEIVAPTH